MDKFLRLYRSLVQSAAGQDATHPYAIALHAFDDMLDIITELDYYSTRVKSEKELAIDEAERMTQFLEEAYKRSLILLHDSNAVEAVTSFVGSHISYKTYPALKANIERCEQDAKMLHDNDSLGDLDDHPF